MSDESPNPSNPFGAPPPPPPITDVPDKDACQWATFCHLAALAQFVVPSLGQVVGPLIVWLMKKDQHPFIDDQGKESLNFQISMTLYAIVGSLAFAATCVLAPLAIVLAIAVVLASVIYCVIGASKASKGEPYRYPLTIRFIK